MPRQPHQVDVANPSASAEPVFRELRCYAWKTLEQLWQQRGLNP